MMVRLAIGLPLQNRKESKNSVPHLEPLGGFTVPVGHKEGGAHDEGALDHGLGPTQNNSVLKYCLFIYAAPP